MRKFLIGVMAILAVAMLATWTAPAANADRWSGGVSVGFGGGYYSPGYYYPGYYYPTTYYYPSYYYPSYYSGYYYPSYSYPTYYYPSYSWGPTVNFGIGYTWGSGGHHHRHH